MTYNNLHTTENSSSGKPEPPRILIVDNDVKFLNHLIASFRHKGYIIDGNTDAKSALSRLGASNFNLLIVDISIPEMGGPDLVYYSNNRWPLMPILITHDQDINPEIIKKIEKTAFISFDKPIENLRILESAVKQALDKNRLCTERAFLSQHLAEIEQSLSEQVATSNRKLNRTEHLYRAILENGRDGVLILDDKGLIIELNQEACSYIGMTRQDLVNFNVSTDFKSVDLAELFQSIVEKLRDDGMCRFNVELHNQPGVDLYLEVFGQRLEDDFHLSLVFLRNIHDRIASQKSLEKRIQQLEDERNYLKSLHESPEKHQYLNPPFSSRMYSHLVDSIPDMFYQIDTTTMLFTYLSPAAEKITGLSCSQLLNAGHDGFISHIHPDDVASYLDHWAKLNRQTQKKNRSVTAEYRFIKPDGEVAWLTDTHLTVHGEDGSVISIEGNIRDVTDIKTAELKYAKQTDQLEREISRRTTALTESERRYRQLFDEAGDIIFTCDSKGKIIELNNRGQELLGRSQDELNETGFCNLLDETSRRSFNRALRVCFDRGVKPMPFQIEYENPQGRKLVLEIQNNPIITGNRVDRSLQVARDLTSRRRTVEALKSLKEFNEEIVRTMSEGIFIENDQGICEFVNPAMAQMLGCSVSDLVGRHLLEFMDPSERDHIISQTENRRQRGAVRYETKMRGANGKTVPVLISSRTRYEGDRQIGGLSVATDLSQTKELERRHLMMRKLLTDEKKLSDIGMLAAGIAHNINSPLTAISGYSQILQQKYPDQQEFELILREINKVEAITRNMMIKSRSEQDKNIRPINLNELIVTELKFLEANLEFKSKVECSVKLAPSVPEISGVYSDFSQVFSNLVNNALDAMYEKSDRKLEITTHLTDDAISLSIKDNGIGIPEKNIPHIFTPFFSTKRPIEDIESDLPTGTGLGLSTTQQLISQYGGRIEIESKEGVGSVFRIFLPRPLSEEVHRSKTFKEKYSSDKRIRGEEETSPKSTKQGYFDKSN